jgi:hypothetical protein
VPLDDGRWPPVYDAEELVAQIRDLTSRADFEARFYEWRLDRNSEAVSDVCQGDVVELASDVPVIGDDGLPGVISNKTQMWMVLGNTCDFDRDLDDCRWTQIAPLVDLGGPEPDPTLRDVLRKYSLARRFYVPPWTDRAEHSYHVVELPLLVAVDKRAFTQAARVQARLSRAAWILLNACLVRSLARDDGRYAA